MRKAFIAVLLFLLPLVVSHAQTQGQEYILVLRPGQAIETLNQVYGTHSIARVPGTPIHLVKADVDSSALQTALQTDFRVESAEKNPHIRLDSASVPFDVASAQQTVASIDGHTMTTFYGTTVLKSYVEQPAVSITHVNEARSISSGAATRVAFIDTGVDFYHPALQAWLEPGADLVFNQTASELDGLSQAMASLLDQAMASLLDERLTFALNQAMASLLDSGNSSETFPSSFGHGTLVAGMIHVVAPEARLVPIKAFDAYGNTTMYTIISALYRAKELNADVVNMSFSITQDSQALKKAISDLYSSGIVMVSSMGNDSLEIKDLFPAAYGQVVGVAATDFNDRRAGFSNFGKSVSVAAPGSYVISTVPGGRYAAAWGTSFSSPLVAGSYALLRSQGRNAQSATQQVINRADGIDQLNPGFEKQLGKGRINVYRALTTN